MRSLSRHHLLFIGIILLSLILRFYQLGSNPPSLDWDEVSLGYNAYSLLETGNDEYGNSWPFSIRSFNDYKPPAYTYLAMPTIALFGLTELAVRLPSALAGVIAVISLYYLVINLDPKYTHIRIYGLISALLLAISPWHLQFSRAAFEANLALTFYLLAVTFFLKWLNQKKWPTFSLLHLSLSAIFASAAIYSYHSARLVLPLFFFFAALLNRQKILAQPKPILISIFLGLTLLSPLLYISFRGTTTQRFSTVSIFTNPGEFSRERERLQRQADFKSSHQNPLKYFHAQKLVYSQIIARNYFEHFNFDFLFLRADGNPRHHASGMGLLYLIELPLLLSGFYYLAKSKLKHKHLVWLILLTGPAASSLTASTPHAIRALLMLPGLIIITAYGAINLISHIKTHHKYFQLLSIVSCLLFFINFIYYLNLYYVITPYQYSQDWQYGYKQLVQKVTAIQDQYTDIIITNRYDQPHIYFAFYQQIDPQDYQSFADTAPQVIDNLHFGPIKELDFLRPNALVVAELDKTPSQANIIDQIKFKNGEVAFNLIETPY